MVFGGIDPTGSEGIIDIIIIARCIRNRNENVFQLILRTTVVSSKKSFLGGSFKSGFTG